MTYKFLLLSLLALATGLSTGPSFGAAPVQPIDIGEFTASRFIHSPKIDGRAADGEWDRAFTTSGLLTPFERTLQESETTMSVGYDQERFYFLFRCRRGDQEWKLWKKARANDDYNFGEPSVEVWVTPPAAVAETYQNVINTFPAVLDIKHIPTRGYAAQGWKGNWQVAVSESDLNYIIEASVPIRDFGIEKVTNGDVWRFLLARNCLGAKPRSQASWSVTGGFTEIPQHVPVQLREDSAVVQLTGVSSVLSGHYDLKLGVVAPPGAGAEAEVEVCFHPGPFPAADDPVERRKVSVAAGSREMLNFAGERPPGEKGNFTVTAKRADGTGFFRQSFAYVVSGWTPQVPSRPEKVPPARELEVSAQFGPQTGTVLVKADLLDLPQRAQVVSSEVRVIDPASGAVLAQGPLKPHGEWYAGAELAIALETVPVNDFRVSAPQRAAWVAARDRNIEHKRLKEPLETLPEVPKTPGKMVQVVVSLKDAAGKEIKSATEELELIRYAAEWMDNQVGLTEKVYPPYTPVVVESGRVEVWNRALALDGLGLARQVTNGGSEQLAMPMRLVAVKDGKETELQAGIPKLQRRVDAEADFSGTAAAAGVRFSAQTRVEFDGFVNVKLNVAPESSLPAKLDRLFLEIVLPAELATHFCTTAGGWSAVHDVLPEHWSSQSTSSGMLVGDFVPYIWLTNSEKGFLWFADHDKGWNHDPDKALPTQQIERKNGKVYLRINFFEIPTEITTARELSWGWQAFPARPLPAGWRATYFAQRAPLPETTNTYFFIDADWAVLWPYYCSPFAWKFDRSKKFLDSAAADPRHRPAVGSIAHSIGRYQDYEWNRFPGLAVDWAASPGHVGNSDVTASKGPNDFRLWHYRRWVREGGFRGLYVDENYLPLDENFLTGNAYWRADGRLQRAYNYLGLREYFKRVKAMFNEEAVPAPNLWQHVSSGAAYYAWPGDVFWEGENVEPSNLDTDYIEVLPAGRLRSIGSSVCAGGVVTMMCQASRHPTRWAAKHIHQFVGWLMAHDVVPEESGLYPRLVAAGQLQRADVRFLPYWKPSAYTTEKAGCVVSAHQTAGRALLWVVNVGRQPAEVAVAVDWKMAGFDPSTMVALNAETGAELALTAQGFTTRVLERDFVAVLLCPRLADGVSFKATFDTGKAVAEMATSSAALESSARVAGTAVPLTADGHAVSLLEAGCKVGAHLHVTDAEGRIAFRAEIPAAARGTLVELGPLSVVFQPGIKAQPRNIQLVVASAEKNVPPQIASAPFPQDGWQRFVLAWKDGRARLLVNEVAVAELPVAALGLNPEVSTFKRLPEIIFAGKKGAALALDDLSLSRTAQ